MRINPAWILVPAVLLLLVDCASTKPRLLTRDNQCPSCRAEIPPSSETGEVQSCESCQEKYARASCAVFACEEIMVIKPDSMENCWSCVKLNFFSTCSGCGRIASSLRNHLGNNCRFCRQPYYGNGTALRSDRSLASD